MCEEKTEEQQTEEEIKTYFSSHYSSDFGDLQKDVLLTDNSEMEVSEDKYKDIITYDDLKEVMNFHLTLVETFTKTEWLNPDKVNHVTFDFVKPLIEKFKIFGPLLQKNINGLNYTMDSELLGSLNVLLAVTKSYGQADELGKLPNQ